MTTDTTPTTAPDELLAARERAIADSGWGRPFHLVQPRNLAFWVWLVPVLFGAWHFVHIFSSFVPIATQGLLIGAIIMGGYGLALLIFFRVVVDRFTRVPLLLIAAAILWGGLAATYGMAILANDANMSLLQKLAGQGFAHDWQASVTAPIVEESSKAAGFLLFLTLAPGLVRSPRIALVIGAFIGLGFQIFEDLIYGANSAGQGFYADQAGSVLHVAALRLATGVISHPAYTALFCVGLLYLIGAPAVRRNVPKGLAFIVTSMLLHAVWDGATAIGDGGAGTALVLAGSLVVAVVALALAFKSAATYDRPWMRAILAPEVASGAVTEAEAAAAAGTRRERRHFKHEGRGHKHHKANDHALDATIDLAHELAVGDGHDGPQVEHARTELVRLR